MSEVQGATHYFSQMLITHTRRELWLRSTTGQPLRMYSAVAMSDCTVMRIDKKSMMEVIHRERAFSDMFVAYLLIRNIRYEADLVDQLFNSSEKRLARVLLLLARFGKDGKPEVAIPKISQETLAEMVGTTRGRVNFFMNRFKKLGLVRYNGELEVHSSLLNVVLHDYNSGIASDHLPNIFRPFSTTKGSGVGLDVPMFRRTAEEPLV